MALKKIKIGGREIQVDEKIATRLALADRDMRKATGQGLSINQDFRTSAQQKEIYDRLSKTGGRVAPPGSSFHEKGLAVDVTNNVQAASFLNKYGLRNDLADDKGHFSYGETKKVKFESLADKVDSFRKKGMTDTEILDSLAKARPEFGPKITSSRLKYNFDSEITNDRDLINYLSVRFSGKMPSTPSIAIKGKLEKTADFAQKNFLQPGANLVSGIAKGFAKPAAKIANSAYNMMDSSLSLVEGGIYSAMGDKNRAKTAFDRADKATTVARDIPGVGKVGTVGLADENGNRLNYREAIKDVLGTGAETYAAYVAPGQIGGLMKNIPGGSVASKMYSGAKKLAAPSAYSSFAYGAGAEAQKPQSTAGSIVGQGAIAAAIGTPIGMLSGAGAGLVQGMKMKWQANDLLSKGITKVNDPNLQSFIDDELDRVIKQIDNKKFKEDFTGSTIDKSGKLIESTKLKFQRILKNNAVTRKAQLEKEALIASAKPQAQEAIRAKVDYRDANLIANQDKQTLLKVKQMTDLADEYVNATGKTKPETVVGEELLRLKEFVDDARQLKGKELNAFAKGITPEKLKNLAPTILESIQKVPGLEGTTMKLTPEGWTLDFSNTEMSLDKAGQKWVNEIFQEALKKDSVGLNSFRREINSILYGKNAYKTKPIELLDEKAAGAINRGLSDALDLANDGYKLKNAEYGKLAEALKDVKNLLKPLEGADDDILNKGAADLSRRLTGNSSAKLEFAIRKLQEAAKEAGMQDVPDIVSLQEAMNVIDKYWDVTAKTGLQGQITSGNLKSIPRTKSGIINSAIDKGVDAFQENVFDPTSNNITKQQAIKEMIQSLLDEVVPDSPVPVAPVAPVAPISPTSAISTPSQVAQLIKDNGGKIDKTDLVTLYHFTDKASAAKIRSTGFMKGAEDGIFFTTSPNGVAAHGFEGEMVTVKVPLSKLQVDDVLMNEVHLRIPTELAGDKVKVNVVKK